jgi:LCP family protein required for cell wall assembly
VPDSAHNAILIIGSDRIIGGTRRADVIMLALIPSDGSSVMLISLPRDLYLENPCGGGRARINGALNGCGSVSGPNLLAVAVEDFTGIPIDHFVMFDYQGFADVIDVAGGIEVCVDYPTYDTRTSPDLDLPAGCSTLDGKMALAWVRSRKTRQIVDGVDQYVPGVGDHTRQARQRNVVLQMIGKLSGFSNPAEIVSLANAASGAFTLDAGLSLTDAVGIAWDLRGRAGSIRSPRIAVDSYVTEAGAWVLVPVEPFFETIG